MLNIHWLSASRLLLLSVSGGRLKNERSFRIISMLQR